MPRHHHADMVRRHHHVEREVLPSEPLPFLFPDSTPTPTNVEPDLSRLVPRADNTCAGGHGCEKPTSNLETTVLPVVLGAGVPIICAIVVLIFLHRRHTKRLLREDAMDKHKSLDFGMDHVPRTGKSGKKLPNGLSPQMMEPAHSKGMSLDIAPYLMPPGLHGSRDSLSSVSRSIDDDKYRPANLVGHDNASIRSYPRTRDDASSIAGSRLGPSEEPNSSLLRNAQRMSRSDPPIHHSPPPEPKFQPNQNQAPLGGVAPAPELDFHFDTPPTLNFETEPSPQENALHDRPNFPLPEAPAEAHVANTPSTQLPRISLPASDVTSSDYGDDHRKSQFIIPEVNIHGAEEPVPEVPLEMPEPSKFPEHPEEPRNLDSGYVNPRDTRRLTLGVRPLPPEDPADNPEQRANRIRSFYKEYFDESKRETTYYEDYGPEYYEDGYGYDPYYDAVPPMPYAEPVGRRAMTPPPRAPPRFQGAARHMATGSAGANSFGTGPRAFSSASGQFPRGPRKPMPPPMPLNVLQSPHLLKDDAIFMAADFAPGSSFRDQRDGRPGTPSGTTRPYSPSIRAHTPLVSTFDELAAIPSPHALRKSGTYNGLDFAPPGRFKTQDGGSETGSIRSMRTGISNAHHNNIRMGNYRVSRLPADMVGTRDDMMASLKPEWGMNR